MTAQERTDTAVKAPQAAAGWWVERITDPEREHCATPEAAAVFAKALEAGITEGLAADAARIEKLTAETGRRPYGVSLPVCVDYDPDDILGAAAEAAGIRERCFPLKTTMLVRPDHVIASWGYGAPYRLVWAAEDWRRPLCDHMRPENGYTRFSDWAAHPSLMMCGLPRYHDEPCGSWIPDTSACRRCGRPQTAHYTREGWEAEDRDIYADEEDARP